MASWIDEYRGGGKKEETRLSRVLREDIRKRGPGISFSGRKEEKYHSIFREISEQRQSILTRGELTQVHRWLNLQDREVVQP